MLYLFELDIVAYFAIYRSSNSFQTITAIRETTQVLLDVYEIDGSIYVHLIKVWNRYLPTIFLPHVFKGNKFLPVINSGEIASLFEALPKNSFVNFFPDLAGVGYSYNTYVWEKGMDPQAGMLRVVLGIGTRAVTTKCRRT